MVMYSHFFSGDNMLTALSVAHECKIVEQKDKVVLVEASVNLDNLGVPQLHFIHEDSVEKAAIFAEKVRF